MTVRQCATCPWRVGADLSKIPGYSPMLHRRLRQTTIAEPGSLRQTAAAMACHYAADGERLPCAGWLAHQLGDGNNIPLRMMVIFGKMPAPEVDGPQHATFEATIGPRKRVAR